MLPCLTPGYITLHWVYNTYNASVHWSLLSALQFRGQYNPFGSLTELQLRLQRSMSLRSQRSSLQPIAVNSQNSLSHSRHLTGSNGLQASSSPSAASLSARQIGRATSTDRLSRSSSTSTVPDSICIESLDYSPSLKMLGVVLTDGRCAICRTADSGLAPAEQLEFSHWICGVGSGATCLGIAPDAQLIAVGLTNGEVALYKLYGHKGGRFSIDGSQAEGPVRVVSLVDWGYGPEATGSVADLKWSPDNRAFAVSFLYACSGCAFAYMHTICITAQPSLPYHVTTSHCSMATPPPGTEYNALKAYAANHHTSLQSLLQHSRSCKVQHVTQSASSDTHRVFRTTDAVTGCSMAIKRSTSFTQKNAPTEHRK